MTIQPTLTFEVLGVLSDDEEGVESDLVSLTVLASSKHVAFDLTFKASNITEILTFLIYLQADSGNFDRLALDTTGDWSLSRSDPAAGVGNFTVQVASGGGVLIGFFGENVWNARVEMERTYLEDIMLKHVWVYCDESLDRMPDLGSSPSSVFLGPVGELGDFTDEEDVDSYPDFTKLRVWASDTVVHLDLSFRQSPSDLFATIYMYADPGNVDYIVLDTAHNRKLQGSDNETDGTVGGVVVDFTVPRVEPGDDDDIGQRPEPETTALISFPRSSMPDLMDKRIWVYSERSNDRMPDDGTTPSYFPLSPP
jgi:hypothetical protein